MVPTILDTSEDRTSGQLVTTKLRFGTEDVFVPNFDEVWLVSARDIEAPVCGPCNFGDLKCSQLICGEFVNQDLSKLVTAHTRDLSKSTIIYVHGNRTDLDYAKSRSLQMYDNLFGHQNCERNCCQRQPLRFVIFAWKSESEISRLIPDFKLKTDRSLIVADAFTSLLNRFEDRNMLLLGYSLGAQIVLKGLEVPAGVETTPGQFRVGLIAPSLSPAYVDDGLSCLPFNAAVNTTRAFVNRNDRAIRVSNLILKTKVRRQPDPLEEVACLGQQLGGVNPISIVDVTAEVSRCHSIVKYTADSNLIQSQILKMIKSLPR
ncbi:MAG: alpha/beta hydrolase [Planctomycetota bacterium]